MSLAIIFNGQGAHYEEMGQDFVDAFPKALEIYERVETLTGYPVRQWITEDFDALQKTRHAQVAIAATSLAIYESIKDQLPKVEYMAGLSLGEYTSLIASGMLSFEDGFNVLKERGQLMTAACEDLQQTSDITMAAVLKMPFHEVEEIIDELNQTKEQLYIANLNSSTQVVIAGPKEAMKQFNTLARERGYKKGIPLKVEGPFHSPYMKAVCEPFTNVLANVAFSQGDVPVISNTMVTPHTTDNVKDLLVDHLVKPVRWKETIDYFSDYGVTHIIQIGPGATLANLLKREPNAPATLVIDQVSDIDAIEAFIQQSDVRSRR